MKALFKILAVCLLLCCFSDCKKYPENRFWGNPTKAKYCPFHGNITHYIVNGIDSLDLLDKYLDSSIANLTNPLTRIKECNFIFDLPHHNEVNVEFWTETGGGSTLAHVNYEFSSNKKKISISFNPFPYYSPWLHKNLFISNDIEWEIIRLSKDSKPFKIKTTLSNGNTYEIQIR